MCSFSYYSAKLLLSSYFIVWSCIWQSHFLLHYNYMILFVLSKHENQFSGLHFVPRKPWCMGEHQETRRRTAKKTRMSKSSQKKETAWWSKKNGRKEEKQTKGINILSLQLVNGRYRFVKFTSFNRMTFRVYKSLYW